VNDIKLEAGAFLCLARQSARVNPEFVRRVVAFRNADGGWGGDKDIDSSIEETALAAGALADFILQSNTTNGIPSLDKSEKSNDFAIKDSFFNKIDRLFDKKTYKK